MARRCRRLPAYFGPHPAIDWLTIRSWFESNRGGRSWWPTNTTFGGTRRPGPGLSSELDEEIDGDLEH